MPGEVETPEQLKIRMRHELESKFSATFEEVGGTLIIHVHEPLLGAGRDGLKTEKGIHINLLGVMINFFVDSHKSVLFRTVEKRGELVPYVGQGIDFPDNKTFFASPHLSKSAQYGQGTPSTGEYTLEDQPLKNDRIVFVYNKQKTQKVHPEKDSTFYAYTFVDNPKDALLAIIYLHKNEQDV